MQKYTKSLIPPNFHAKNGFPSQKQFNTKTRRRKERILSGFASQRLKILLDNLISPKILHQFSIDTPSRRWTIDGVSMEYPIWKKGESSA